MSTFLEKADYNYQLREYRLNQIIDDTDSILDDAEEEAIAHVKDFLFEHYDTETIFNATGDDRPKNVLRWCKNVVLYYLYDRVPDELVPDKVIKNFDDTNDTLTKIAAGKMSVDLPRKTTEEGKEITKFRWGSQPARTH